VTTLVENLGSLREGAVLNDHLQELQEDFDFFRISFEAPAR